MVGSGFPAISLTWHMPFWSPDQADIMKSIEAEVCPEDVCFFQQRLCEARVQVHAHDGVVTVRPRQGTLQGDSVAGDLFMKPFNKKATKWVGASRKHLGGHHLFAKAACLDKPVDLSISTFLDDVLRRCVFRNLTHLKFAARYVSQTFTEEMQPRIKQNTDKAEHLLAIMGSGTHQIVGEINAGRSNIVPWIPSRTARYLGPYLHHMGKVGHEIKNRCAAIDKSWDDMHSFWSSNVPMSVLVLMFLIHVVSIALSGMEAFALIASELETLDKRIVFYGRKLLQGKACTKNHDPGGEIQYHNLSNYQVHCQIKVAHVSIELRIRKLRWWQHVAQDKENHTGLISAFFGNLPHEPPLFNDIGVIVGTAHPWLIQLCEDIHALDVFNDADFAIPLATSPPRMFDPFCAEDFVKFDVSQLRERYLKQSNCVPPPGYVGPPVSLDDPGNPAPHMEDAWGNELPWVCKIIREDGEYCGKAFRTRKAMLAHQRSSGEFGHQQTDPHCSFVLRAQCPWCQSCFASQLSTVHHVQLAFSEDYCPIQASNVKHKIPKEAFSECYSCGQTFYDVNEYNEHVRTHVAPPAQKVVARSARFLLSSSRSNNPSPKPKEEPQPRSFRSHGQSVVSRSSTFKRRRAVSSSAKDRRANSRIYQRGSQCDRSRHSASVPPVESSVFHFNHDDTCAFQVPRSSRHAKSRSDLSRDLQREKTVRAQEGPSMVVDFRRPFARPEIRNAGKEFCTRVGSSAISSQCSRNLSRENRRRPEQFEECSRRMPCENPRSKCRDGYDSPPFNTRVQGTAGWNPAAARNPLQDGSQLRPRTTNQARAQTPDARCTSRQVSHSSTSDREQSRKAFSDLLRRAGLK